MRFIIIVLLVILISGLPSCKKKPETLNERIEYWKDLKFGMFIHWGPVSLKGTEISWSRGREIPVEEYDNLYKQFNPVKFDADAWVRLAKDAGMKYIVFTSKHHDGFCMWNTRYNNYNIMNSPFKRDVMKELAAACKKHGIDLGFYYSTCDWHHPDFPLTGPGGTVEREISDIDRYTDYLKKQSAEIIENYGPLLVMWYDVPQRFDSVRGQSVIDHIRSVQNNILVNNRTGARGDFDTPERRIGSFQTERPWESCMTIAQQWAWKPNDIVRSTEQCLHALIRTAGGDGNLLLNIGPKPDGTIEPQQAQVLRELGVWLRKHGKSVYGTRGGPYKPSDWGVSTRKDNKIYLHLLNIPDNNQILAIPYPGKNILKCSLSGGQPLKYSTDKKVVHIEFDNQPLDSLDTVVEIMLDGSAMDIEPMEVKPFSAAYQKPVSASSNTKPVWLNHQWIDMRSLVNGEWSGAFWQPEENDNLPWVEIDLGEMIKISKAILFERGDNIKSYELQGKYGDQWQSFFKGDTIGGKIQISFPETEIRYFRLLIYEFSDIPGIYEIILF